MQQTCDRCAGPAYRKYPTDLSALLLGDLYYTRLSVSGVSKDLTHSALVELFQILHANISSNICKVCHWTRELFFS